MFWRLKWKIEEKVGPSRAKVFRSKRALYAWMTRIRLPFGHLFVSGFAHLIPLLSGLNSKKQEPQIVVNGVTGGMTGGGSNYNNLLGKSTKASWACFMKQKKQKQGIHLLSVCIIHHCGTTAVLFQRPLRNILVVSFSCRFWVRNLVTRRQRRSVQRCWLFIGNL